MKVRSLNPKDVPILEQMAARSGYPYPKTDAANVEMVLVVADDEDRPLMAVAIERIVQAYLWKSQMDPVSARRGIDLLLAHGREMLLRRGYSEINAFLPPELAAKFGKRLQKTYDFQQNWLSYFLRL